MTPPAAILVVEDNPVTREWVGATLEREGYTILEARDARTALELMADVRPDLILQDLTLPDMDGFELADRLRALSEGADIPIIACAGSLSRLEAERMATLGFAEFLIKPVEPSRLVKSVRDFLPPPRTEVAPPGQERHVLAVDDDPVQLKLMRLHLTRLGFRVTTASDGAEALELACRSLPDAIVSDVLMPRMHGFQLCVAVRRDRRLAGVPVILCSDKPIGETDRALAGMVGASGLAFGTPDCREAIELLLASLREPAPRPEAPIQGGEEVHLHRMIRELERQVARGVALVQRTSFQAAVLSMLAKLSPQLLGSRLDGQIAPAEVLGGLLDVDGLSAGALYLYGADGRLSLRAHQGYPQERVAQLADVCGHPELLEGSVVGATVVVIPSAAVPASVADDFLARAGVKSALLVLLVSRKERIGVLMLGSKTRDLGDTNWRPFVRTLGGRIAQTIAVSRAFSREAAAETRYRTLFENAVEGIFQASPEGRPLLANPALARILGYESSAALLAHVTDVASRLCEDREQAFEFRRLLAEPGVVSGFEVRTSRIDGSTVWLSLTARAVRDAAGGLLHVEGRVEDVTTRKRAEEELKHQREFLYQHEKLAALGQLLAGVSHELNNPLAVIMGQAALLERETEGGPEGARVEKILEAAERCARIVQNFLALARQHPLERREVALNEVVEETLELTSYSLRMDNVLVQRDLASDIPALWADPHELQQMLINLVANAHQAMRGVQEPRRLSVTTRFDRVRRTATIEVADTGPGIPRDVRPRIFEPFFTTKPPGQGTGLGLSLCQSMIESHGGTLAVESEPGHGAVFRVELPVTSRERREPSPPAAVSFTGPAGKEILVVDDEPDVAQVLAELLRLDGHRVEIVSNGATALRRILEQPFDLVLCDLRMPELDGPGLYRELERRRPEALRRLVFVSGDALSPDSGDLLERDGVPSLRKPFRVEEVRQVLEQMLGQSAREPDRGPAEDRRLG